jgi:hypothetical protein
MKASSGLRFRKTEKVLINSIEKGGVVMGLFFRKKTRDEGLICIQCKAKITKNEVGMVFVPSDHTTYTFAKTIDLPIDESYSVACKKCAPKVMVMKILMSAKEERRDLTIDELRLCERKWNANGIEEFLSKENMEESLHENAARYNSITLNSERNLIINFTCPKCFGPTTALIQGALFSNEVSGQLDAYMWINPQVDMTCPQCNHQFILVK